jgi:hypothetical protein
VLWIVCSRLPFPSNRFGEEDGGQDGEIASGWSQELASYLDPSSCPDGLEHER